MQMMAHVYLCVAETENIACRHKADGHHQVEQTAVPCAGDVVSLGDGRLADGHVRSFFLKEGQTVSDNDPLLCIPQCKV
jgi:hypothetical protein